MSKAKPAPAAPAISTHPAVNSAMSGWGAKVVNKRTPSGLKLVLEPDSDCILRFEGYRDVTEKVLARGGRLKEDETAIKYASFFDGKRFVTMSASTYAFSEIEFEPGHFYYIHHEGLVEMGNGLNPMKDFLILDLGVTGDRITVPTRVDDSGEFTLAPDAIAIVNYTRLNYPLR